MKIKHGFVLAFLGGIVLMLGCGKEPARAKQPIDGTSSKSAAGNASTATLWTSPAKPLPQKTATLSNDTPEDPTQRMLREAKERSERSTELKYLAVGYLNYIDTMGRAPNNPTELASQYDAKLLEKVKDGTYVLFMGYDMRANQGGAEDTILGYLWTTPSEGGSVVFANGSVQYLAPGSFANAKKAGEPPVSK